MSRQCKRVLHFIDSEGVYGAERVILNLSQEMKRPESQYVPVVGCIVNNAGDRNALFDAAAAIDVEAIKIPIANKALLRDIWRAAHQLREAEIDLIHSHGYKPSVFGTAIRLLAKIPVIATCHLWFEPSKGPLKMRVMVAIEKYCYRWFPRVLVVSEAIRRVLLDNGVESARVAVIPNGVDIRQPTPEKFAREKTRNELGVNSNAFCVLNAGRLARQKSQWTIVEAAALLKADGYNCQFMIVGEGGLKQQLANLITQKGVSDCVRLLGFRGDMDRLLSAADAFVLPSLDEGMPMSLLEAAAANVPIIATAVGDIPKLVQHEQSGLIVPPENAAVLAQSIARLIEDRSLSKRLAESAFERMQKTYSSAAMGARYQEIYAEVLGDHESFPAAV